MTAYSHAELRGLDLDWFGVDINGCVGHFTNNGTSLVPSGANDRYSLEAVLAFMEGLREISDNSIVSNILLKWNMWMEGASESRVREYVDASREWSDRGFYSYDCRRSGGREEELYFRVTSPKAPLLSESLPIDIRSQIERVIFQFSFDEKEEISSSLIFP